MDDYDITHKNDKWKFKKQGTDRAIKTAETKDEIVDYMRDYMADKVGSVKIHKKNGIIQEERTYPRKADPKKTPG
jgi:hypothetical protein